MPSAIFSVQEEVDNKIVIVPIRFLRPLLQRETAVSTVECSIKAGADVEKIKKQLAAQTGNNFKIQNRFEQREGFYKVLKSEKLISYIILFFILLVASTNSIGSLYILVMEKKKDIKMLAALGLPTPQIGNVFQWNSFFIAFFGGSLGVFTGIVLTYLQQTYGFVKLNQSGTFISIAYPVELQTSDVLLVCITVLAIGFLASLYPSFKARRLV